MVRETRGTGTHGTGTHGTQRTSGALLLATLLTIAPVSVAEETPADQAEAITALRGIASNIQKNRDGTVRFVRFSKAVVKDDHLRHIRPFRQLDYLAVVTPNVTDAGLEHIAVLDNLDTLILTNTQLTDGVLKTFSTLAKLEVLYLDKTQITADGLAALSSLTSLHTLWLNETQIGNGAIAHLPESLKVLSLTGTPIDDAALASLTRLTNLETLFLDRTRVTGATLSELARLSQLKFLSLASTPIAAESLTELAGFPKLEQVNLYKTAVTESSVPASLREVARLRIQASAERVVVGEEATDPRDSVETPARTPFQRFLSGEGLRAAPTATMASTDANVGATDIVPSVRERLPTVRDDESAVVDFQRHVIPLLGTLGCNGRACHGSFQGKGGFTLSMFGYDFAADHTALLAENRVDTTNPSASLVLRKPTEQEDHGGGLRYEVASWEHALLHRWIASGAPPKRQLERLVDLHVEPREIRFGGDDEVVALRVVATWENGDREDVTSLARYESKDDQVAGVQRGGRVTSVSPGDTHVLVTYDKVTHAIPVLRPVSNTVGENYPDVETPTEIDRLIVEKLAKLGIVPSDVCSDEDYLRRVFLDLAGTLPSPADIEAFVADTAANKRDQIVERLLESEAYATWWGMWLTDLTGSNIQLLGGTDINWAAAGQWERWVKQRVRDNDGWDKIAAAILLATSRRPNQSYNEYAAEQSHHLRRKDPVDDTTLDFPMHHYWFRGNATKPVDRALSFGYIFLGVRLQCAQCHKHPFDQWSKQDFDQFTNFFSRMTLGANEDAKVEREQLRTRLGVPVKLDTAALRRQMYMRVYAEGLPIPYVEVVIRDAGDKPTLTRTLGGDEFDLNAFRDPREPLVEWLLRPDNPYFARAFVNRIWARYFGRGIVDPPDDLNVGNPPTNAALLDWLASEFVAHGYDMKWLHRTITASHAYQRSWRTNATNAKDERHFSHSRLRRLPAEVIVDAMLQATDNQQRNRNYLADMNDRRIGKHPGNLSPSSFDYALMVFGKPTRSTNCDCERKAQPTLLQSLYTRNDAELMERIERTNGWVAQVAHQLELPLASRTELGKTIAADRSAKLRIAIDDGEMTPDWLVEQAYLRTLSRRPTDEERSRSVQYIQSSENIVEGLRDVMWALLNTQEFLTNH